MSNGLKIKAKTEPVEYDAMTIGDIVKVSRKTPLMPELKPKGRWKARLALIARRSTLDAKWVFKVIGHGDKRGVTWYQVEANCGTWWINSTALVGQVLKRMVLCR